MLHALTLERQRLSGQAGQGQVSGRRFHALHGNHAGQGHIVGVRATDLDQGRVGNAWLRLVNLHLWRHSVGVDVINDEASADAYQLLGGGDGSWSIIKTKVYYSQELMRQYTDNLCAKGGLEAGVEITKAE